VAMKKPQLKAETIKVSMDAHLANGTPKGAASMSILLVLIATRDNRLNVALFGRTPFPEMG